jgi:hypothetical protein
MDIPATDSQASEPLVIKDEELKLIRRLRQLPSGAHLVILLVDGNGVYGLTLASGSRVERFRKAEKPVS